MSMVRRSIGPHLIGPFWFFSKMTTDLTRSFTRAVLLRSEPIASFLATPAQGSSFASNPSSSAAIAQKASSSSSTTDAVLQRRPGDAELHLPGGVQPSHRHVHPDANVVANFVADLDAAIVEWSADSGAHAEPARARSSAAELEALLSRCAAEGTVVRATRTGFIQEIAHMNLVAAAERAQAVVRLLYRPGQFVMEHAVLGYVILPDRAAALGPLVERHVRIGTHRTLK